ncbi:hypothetical protein Q8F55_008963 [Vanrija albida]|uniref:Uncharacterized protein n=1 Tax=Vanrija albida TaxID=181172 RepID=A0ABR3PSC3_9TREE
MLKPEPARQHDTWYIPLSVDAGGTNSASLPASSLPSSFPASADKSPKADGWWNRLVKEKKLDEGKADEGKATKRWSRGVDVLVGGGKKH